MCGVAVHDAIVNKSWWGAWFLRMIAGGQFSGTVDLILVGFTGFEVVVGRDRAMHKGGPS